METVFDIREHEDLSDIIDVLMGSQNDLKLLSFWSFLNSNLSAKAQKHEYQDDIVHFETITAIASGAGADWATTSDTTALPVTTTEVKKLKVGDVLLLPTGSEIVVVKSIDDTGSIDVYSRGWAGTTATSQGTSQFTITIIGNAQIDGSDPINGNFNVPTEKYNYVQIFEDKVDVSGSLLRSFVTAQNEHDRQVGIKLKSLMSRLNKALWYGERAIDSTNKLATMNGIRKQLTTSSNIGGNLSLTKLYTAVEALMNAGGSPTAIHGSIHAISAIEQLFSNSITRDANQGNNRFNLTVKTISLLGMDVELRPDRHIASSEFAIIDDSKISFGTQDGNLSGAFTEYEIERNGKQWKTQIVGYYTNEVRQAAAAGVRCYGLT